MATLVLDAFTKAYPSIFNDIRASLSYSDNPNSIIASIVDSTPSHPARAYNFTGLPRKVYNFSLDEIDNSGNVISNLALFSVVPQSIGQLLTRAEEQIKVGTTTGFDDQQNFFLFDGTLGKPDYVGWEIVPSELTGRGILVKGLDYNWDASTGLFQLLQNGDVFQDENFYNIHFEPKQNNAGGSPLTVNDFSIREINDGTNVLYADFGNKVIFFPEANNSNYQEVFLPNISTIPDGRKVMIEGHSVFEGTTKLIPFGSDEMIFPKNYIYIMGDESLSIYKYTKQGVSKWRICEEVGAFREAGKIITYTLSDPQSISQLLEKNIRLPDGDLQVFSKYVHGRLYDYVLSLPINEVVNYDEWSAGANNRFYSLANSSNPALQDSFHVPNWSNLFEEVNFQEGIGSSNKRQFKNELPSTISNGIPVGLKKVTIYKYIQL